MPLTNIWTKLVKEAQTLGQTWIGHKLDRGVTMTAFAYLQKALEENVATATRVKPIEVILGLKKAV